MSENRGNIMRFWPLFVAVVVVILSWAKGSMEVRQSLDNDHSIMERLRELEAWKIEQLLVNTEIVTRQNDLDKFLDINFCKKSGNGNGYDPQ